MAEIMMSAIISTGKLQRQALAKTYEIYVTCRGKVSVA